MRTLEFAEAFSSIQLLASYSAATSSSVEYVKGPPFTVIVVTTLGASGSPAVMTEALPPFHSPALTDPSV